jgi:hypothetical protein
MIEGYGEPDEFVRSSKRSNHCMIAWKRWSPSNDWAYLAIVFLEPVDGTSSIMIIYADILKDVGRLKRTFDNQ